MGTPIHCNQQKIISLECPYYREPETGECPCDRCSQSLFSIHLGLL